MTINLKAVDGVVIQPIHRATCHCGAVQIELQLPDGLIDVRRCDCSMCRRRDAIAATVPLSGITVLKGADLLKQYQFNTKTAKHYFCSNCGIYTHHQRRSNPAQYGFNVACLEGVNPLKIENITIYDGVNHPADRVSYQPAGYSDLDAIKHLLKSYGLPSSDFKDHLGNFIVAKKADELVGVGGYEACKEYALLRSFAVNGSHTGLGIAEGIFKLVQQQAVQSGVKRFYLLTDTAIKYFERLEFSKCSRNKAPEIIRNTQQCAELCPDTATMMYKDLGIPPVAE